MTRSKGPFKADNPWRRIGWSLAAGLVLVSAVLGFLVLSREQQNGPPLSPWAAICAGLGFTSSTRAADEPQPRKTIRADKAPTTGYSLVVDGHFKSHHDTVEAAEEAGMALKNKFQMLQVQVYDAENKTRSMIDWPGPA